MGWLVVVGVVIFGVILFSNLRVSAVLGNLMANLNQGSFQQNSSLKQSSSPVLPTPELVYQVQTLPQAVVYSLEIPQNYFPSINIAVANELQTLPRFAASSSTPISPPGAIAPALNPVIAILNGGFFDPQNQLSTSFVTTQGQVVADPRQNPRLMENPQLTSYLARILDRSELRLYICNPNNSNSNSSQANNPTKHYQITNHSQPSPTNCQITEAVGGGPQLLPVLTAREEGFFETENGVVVRDAIGLNQPNARTAVGIKANGNLVWVMVAQKSENPRNSGLSLPDLAKFMQQMGVIQALNLDGGSSSSFYYRGQTFYGKVNGEGDRIQRAVKSVLVLQENRN